MLPYVSWSSGYNIDPRKLHGYLLNPTGNSPAKARWWLAQGFTASDLRPLNEALFEHTSATNFAGVRVNSWGLRFLFEGPIRVPLTTNPVVRSIWQVGYGTPNGDAGIADFITAHKV